MKSRVCMGLVVGIVFLTAHGVRADTAVGGLICADSTWDVAGSPYVVTDGSGIVIGCDATLTIDPHVVVMFENFRGNVLNAVVVVDVAQGLEFDFKEVC